MAETVTERLDVTISESEPRVTLRLNGGRGNIRAGGSGTDGDLLLFPEAAPDITDDRRATIWLDSGNGNIALGGNNTDGDILLFPRTATISTTATAQASIWLDSGNGNIAVGGNNTDGDILLFPRTATISSTATADANIWLDADPGNISLNGGLIPKAAPAADRELPGFSVNEGATAAFQGSRRFGVIDFTHEHPPAAGDREKLREIWIFNPLLHANSIVLVTPHTATAVAQTVGNMERRHGITGGEGRFIDLTLIRKLVPGTHVRIVYWILN